MKLIAKSIQTSIEIPKGELKTISVLIHKIAKISIQEYFSLSHN